LGFHLLHGAELRGAILLARGAELCRRILHGANAVEAQLREVRGVRAGGARDGAAEVREPGTLI
jgi:hypothetical protein